MLPWNEIAQQLFPRHSVRSLSLHFSIDHDSTATAVVNLDSGDIGEISRILLRDGWDAHETLDSGG